jgi:hypothetical protein
MALIMDAIQGKLLPWHRTGLSNGPTEATNLLIKKIQRVGHGFRNFGNCRLRLPLHCEAQWQTRPAAPIRGHQPRLVASSQKGPKVPSKPRPPPLRRGVPFCRRLGL